MWWKVYFLFDIVLLIVSILSFFSPEQQNILAHIFLIVTYCIGLVGLYFYAFRKPLFYPRFWKIYFWFYLILDAVYFIYGFLPAFLTHYVSFLAVYQGDTYLDSIINTVLDVPLLIALYKLPYGLQSSGKKVVKKKTSADSFRWGMIQMALWGYSSVIIFFLFILAFFPSSGSTSAQDISGSAFLTIMFLPLLVFWVWILIQYKKYRWNWWRATLLANALLYSGFIVFGSLFPQSQQDNTAGGFDIVGILQLLILLVSLYVFGRDQFTLQPRKK